MKLSPQASLQVGSLASVTATSLLASFPLMQVHLADLQTVEPAWGV